MIRILHVIRKMDCGGAETVIMNLYRNINRAEYQFDFVVHSTEEGFYDNEITQLGGIIYHIPPFTRKNIFIYRQAWIQLLKEHPEYKIIHGHIGSTAAIYLSIAKKFGLKTIAHSHATSSPIHRFRNIVWSLFSFPTRYIADYFLACSKQAGIDRYGKRLVRSNSFSVLLNGISPAKYRYSISQRNIIRKEMNVGEKTLVIGHVGRFSPEKNHQFLVSLMAEIQKSTKDFQLWLIGKGPLENSLKKQITDIHMQDRVRFIGVTDNVPLYLQGMDIFVFPSIYEGLGIAVVEAQAAGLPCVVSDCIVSEADIGANLITRVKLSSSIKNWVDTIMQKRNYQRKDTSFQVCKSGFNIQQTAKELEAFYRSL